MALLATLYDHRRAAERQSLDADATLRRDGRPFDALVANISASGCLFVCAEPLEVGDTVTIGIAGIGRHDVRVVRALDTRYGAEFVPPLTAAEIAAAAALPGETVVALPLPSIAPDAAAVAPSASRLAPAARLAVVAALAAAAWFPVVAGLRALAG